jgi:hypothetical protein
VHRSLELLRSAPQRGPKLPDRHMLDLPGLSSCPSPKLIHLYFHQLEKKGCNVADPGYMRSGRGILEPDDILAKDRRLETVRCSALFGNATA